VSETATMELISVSLQKACKWHSHKPGSTCQYSPAGPRSSLQGVTTLWPVSNYTVCWQRYEGVNNLPKAVMQQHQESSETCDLQITRPNFEPERDKVELVMDA